MSTSLIAHLGSRLNWAALLLMCAATAVTLGLYFADVYFDLETQMLSPLAVYQDTALMDGYYTMFARMISLTFQGSFLFIAAGWLAYLALPVHPMKSALLGATLTAFMSVSVGLSIPGLLSMNAFGL